MALSSDKIWNVWKDYPTLISSNSRTVRKEIICNGNWKLNGLYLIEKSVVRYLLTAKERNLPTKRGASTSMSGICNKMIRSFSAHLEWGLSKGTSPCFNEVYDHWKLVSFFSEELFEPPSRIKSLTLFHSSYVVTFRVRENPLLSWPRLKFHVIRYQNLSLLANALPPTATIKGNSGLSKSIKDEPTIGTPHMPCTFMRYNTSGFVPLHTDTRKNAHYLL